MQMTILNTTSGPTGGMEMTETGLVNGRTKLLGLLATPIGHSLSPAA